MVTNAEISASIQRKDRECFDLWISNPENKGRLDIPADPLRFLIAPRIFDFAENPANVRPIVNWFQREFLQFYVAERKEHPLTDINELRAYDKSREDLQPGGKLTIPPTLDYFHRVHSDAVYQGVLELNDFVFNSVILDVMPHGNLYVTSYGDRPELRGKGVGWGFYKEKLREFALRSGFRFISGHVGDEDEPGSNYTYYTKKLGRKRLEELPKHIRDLLAEQEEYEEGVFTVECLDPLDLVDRLF